MRIGLIGTGNMGKTVAAVADEFGHEINAQFNRQNPVAPAGVKQCDVLIDFSVADAIHDNIQAALAADVPLVTGTTGWFDEIEKIKRQVEAGDGSVLFAANFSIGVLLFQRVLADAAARYSHFEHYDFGLHEFHHTGKRDSPSGTALMLANTLLENIPYKDHLVTEPSVGKMKPGALHVTSTRVGRIPGTHQVNIESDEDSIELKHSARGRTGFAKGAIRAAEWLIGKKGFFSIDDMLNELGV